MIRIATEWYTLSERYPETDDLCEFIVLEDGGQVVREVTGWCFGTYLRGIDGRKHHIEDAENVLWCSLLEAWPPEARKHIWNLQRD